MANSSKAATLTFCKPCFGTLLGMPNHSAAANVHHFMRIEPPDASDPVPQMRREIARLRIEMEHLRAKDNEARRTIREEEARKMKEFLAAYVDRVEQLRQSRDHWRREAERLSALTAQGHEQRLKKPHWFASKAWRNLKTCLQLWATGDLIWHPPRRHLWWSVPCTGRLPL
jgi:hypothetical protein